MKKVLFPIGGGVYPHKTGGMEIFNYHLIRNLSESFEIYYSADRDYDFKGAKRLNTTHIRPRKLFEPLEVFFHLIRHRDIKSLVISYSEASWVIWMAYTWIVKILGLRCTIVIHYGKPVTDSKIKVMRDFFKCASTVVAVSDDIKKDYDSVYGIDCKVILPIIPFEKSSKDKSEARTCFDISHDAFVVTMVGSLKKMKNPDTILDCLSKFSEYELEKYNPLALFAGDGEFRPALEQMIADKGLEKHAKLLGILRQDKIKDVLRASDCFLIASDFEGTSVSLMEAMSNGMPVLASDVSGLNKMIEDNVSGLLFERRNADDLKKKIISLYEDPCLAERLSRCAGMRYLEKYDYGNVISTYSEII